MYTSATVAILIVITSWHVIKNAQIKKETLVIFVDYHVDYSNMKYSDIAIVIF